MTMERIRMAGLLVFLTVLGFFVSDITVHAMSAQIVQPPQAVVSAAPAVAPSSAPLTRDQIVAKTARLMAPPPVPIGAATPDPGQPSGVANGPWDQWLQNPQQSLTLVGTLVGDTDSIAVVAANGQQYTLKTGEPLGRWRVVEITDYDVTFANANRDITHLTLPMLSSNSPAPGAPNPTMNMPNHPVASSSLHAGRRGRTIVLQRPEVNAVIATPGAIMNGIRMDAIAKDGQPYGVKVNFLEPSNMFFAMGLRQGDVLTSINGQDLRTPDDAIKAYLILKNENALNIKIDRGASSMNIPVEIQ